ncbi:MAG: hypothetical protein HC918_12510 [Oscillatoriales cyanobacterium SM2_1_8]|nr:hypothetical protein [Oscillatoriales cyanobacterium SM2_1_8]
MSAFKPAEDGQGWVLRVYESWGQTTTAEIALAWPLQRVQRCDLMEIPQQEIAVASDRFAATLTPFAIATFYLTFFGVKPTARPARQW